MVETLSKLDIVQNQIYVIRGHKVMLDSDLAKLYEVKTKVLNQAVKRNIERFPEDFMFQLADLEWENLRSQIVTSKVIPGGRNYNPYVFTEQGVSMLSSVLRSEKAIKVNIQIMRAFVAMRQMLNTTQEMQKRLVDLEARLDKTDENVIAILAAIRQLMAPDDTGAKPRVGF